MINEYFLIVFPLDIDISKLHLKKYGLKLSKMESSYVTKVLNDPSFERLAPEVKNHLRYISSNNLSNYCYVISSKSSDSTLSLLYEVLQLVKPSTLKALALIRARFKNQGTRKILWQITSVRTFPFDIDTTVKNPLFLFDKYSLFQKLLHNYTLLGSNSNINKLLNIYFEAINEVKPHAKLILLMMLIETLNGNDIEAGINYKIRRTCAVFLGDDLPMCERIYKNMGKIYSARSALVHNAKFDGFTIAMINYLHCSVCEILSMLLLTKMQFNEVFNTGNKYGFGDRHLILSSYGITNDLRFASNINQLRTLI